MSRAGYLGRRLGYALQQRLLERDRRAHPAVVPAPPHPPATPLEARAVALDACEPAIVPEGQERLTAFMERFCHYRGDYTRQWRGVDRQSGEATYGWARVGKRQPDDCILTPAVVAAHLRGAITVGTYLLDPQNTCRLVVLDHDDKRTLPDGTAIPEDGLRHLQDCRERLRQQGIACAVSESRRGGHLFIFLDEAVPARDARALACLALGEEEVDRMAQGHQAFEIYPKHDRAAGVGSSIALPLGVHLKDGQRHPFVDSYGEAVAGTLRGQIASVVALEYCPVRAVLQARPWLYEDLDRAMHPARPRTLLPDQPRHERERPNATREPERWASGRPGLIARWKAGVDARDVVQSYGVTLDAHGAGHCPFHDDAHASFVVYQDRWYCFAEGRGGDALSFICEMENLAPKEALALARERFPAPGLGRDEGPRPPRGRA